MSKKHLAGGLGGREPENTFTREPYSGPKKERCSFCEKIFQLSDLAKATRANVPSIHQEQLKDLTKPLICRKCRGLGSRQEERKLRVEREAGSGRDERLARVSVMGYHKRRHHIPSRYFRSSAKTLPRDIFGNPTTPTSSPKPENGDKTESNLGLIAPIEEVEQEGYRPHQVVLLVGLAAYGIIVAWGKLTGGLNRTFEVYDFNITEISFEHNEVWIGFVIFIISLIVSNYLEDRGK